MNPYFTPVRKVFVPFSGNGGDRITIIPGQDYEYIVTEVIARLDGTPTSGALVIWKSNGEKLLEIPLPVSPEPIYVDGAVWTVDKEAELILEIPAGPVMSGKLMIEVVSER